MAYRDLVKQAATVNGTGAFTLGAAVSGEFQTMHIGRSIGEEIEYTFVKDAQSETGIGTLTEPNTLARTTVVSSSNNGALVPFAAGIGEIRETVTSRSMNYGLINPRDPGFDIVLCAGQSRMVGLGAVVANIDIADSRVFQFGSFPSETATYQKIVSGVDPLKHPFESAPGLSPASWFSKTYAGTIPSNRKVLLVPVAQGGQALVYLGGSAVKWAPGNPGGILYETAISQANAALAAAQLLYPNSRFVGTLWAQGESDGDWTISTAAYASALKNLIAGFRSRITGAADSWFVIGGMVPEAISTHAGYPAIQAAHIQVASETAKCAYVAGNIGYHNGDNLHDNAQGARMQGCGMAIAVPKAMRNPGGPDTIKPTASSSLVANSAPTIVAITMSEAMDAAYVPAASAFTVGGHAVTNVGIVGTVINLTCSTAFVNGEAARMVAYVQPGANPARDVAGNLLDSFSALAIANNVAAVDSVAPAFSSAQVVNSQPAVILVTMNETLAASIPPNSAFTPSGGRTVTGVTIAGTVASVTVDTPYTNADTITIAYTQPGANPRLQDAAGNATLTFAAQSVTNGIAAASSAPVRFAQLQNMTEPSTTPPYGYVGGGSNYTSSPMGGVSTTALAGDGSITVQVGNGAGKPILGLKTGATLQNYASLPYTLFADTAGYSRIDTSSGATAGTTGTVVASGDLMRLTRTGTTVAAAVSKNGGTSWTTIYTWAGVPAGTLYAQIMVELSGTLTGPVGTGFA